MLDINQTQLLNFESAFLGVSGVTITVFDEFGTKLYQNAKNGCPLFTLVKEIPDLAKNCFESDNVALKSLKSNEDISYYTCPYGLTKIIIPIKENNIVIGYIKLSRIILDTDYEKMLNITKNTAKKYNIDEKVLLDLISKIPIVTKQKIKDIAYIMKLCLTYLLYNKIFINKDNTLAYLLNNYVKNNISKELTTKSICSYLHISKTTLYKLSLSQFKMSINQYVTKVRFDTACKMLLNSNDTISEISYNVGIFDASYFSRHFKKTYGVSPNEYRKNNK